MNKETENQNSSSQFLKPDAGKTKSNAIETPSISLPKGGGAIRGIDEKFSVNAINGTASFSIPLPVAQARGVTPALNLSYNSGSGNGIFGLGWSLGLSSIKRKTDKELPKYFDAVDSDTFLFSQTEDLVPEYKKEADGSFSKDADGNYVIHEQDSADGLFTVRFYKPRIEGLFARIERWTNKTSSAIKWRVITRENVTTLFGWSDQSRLTDPKEESRIFEWFPEFVFDDKGNCAQYIYKKEDDEGFDGSFLHNRNRLLNGNITYTNLYLEKVLYGNKTPYKKFNDSFSPETDYMFQTVLDYGEYDTDAPYEKNGVWDFREDAFSNYKAGFEIRTTRLCKRVLLYHFFDELPNGSVLVKSLDFNHDTDREDFSFLSSVTACCYKKQSDGTYTRKSLPPTEFEYQKHEWNVDTKAVSCEDLIHAPSGLDEPLYQFTDLFNEGLSGILTEQAGGWYYKHNLGNGKFEQARLVSAKPSFTGLGSQLQLADLDADGGKQIAHLNSEPKGFFELNDEEEWQPFKTFEKLPNIDLNDPNTRMLDLNGDGKPDLLISEDNVFVWYESLGRKGFSGAKRISHPFDEEKGPHIIFADPTQSIFLADMSGDGLSDIVRIRNGEICYWPNLGYGKFGAKIGMDNAPLFDYPDAFNPAYLRIADIDGSGTPDIIYLGKDRFTCWMNLSGNSFAKKPFEISPFPKIDNQAKITVTDLLGNGVACIVWSSPLEKDAQSPLKYIDLMNSKKPHIMVSYKNNLGKKVSFTYAPSTKFYLADKLAGKPWITKLSFPLHVVEKITVSDKWEKSRFATSYSYHHGYYDHHEREFRGFGRVEQTDVEIFGEFAAGNSASPYISDDKTLYQPPVKTVTWFHTGAFLDGERILSQFKEEYFPAWFEDENPGAINILGDFTENDLPEPDLQQQDLTTREWREALRACKGMTLRQEVYELDVDALEAGEQKPVKLFSSGYHNANIQRLQPQSFNRHAVFLVTESEAITYHYELDLKQETLTPDPRIKHTLNLNIDFYGNVLQAVAVVYPRLQSYEDNTLPDGTQELIARVQQERYLSYSEMHYTNNVIEANNLRLRMPCETLTYELTGISPDSSYFTLDELRGYRLSEEYQTSGTSVEPIDYHQLPADNVHQKRLIEHSRILYFDDNLTAPLLPGEINSLGLPYETYTLAFTESLLAIVFGNKLDDVHEDLEDTTKSGYLSGSALASRFPDIDTTGQFWIRSGIAGFADDAAEHFYLPERYTDPFGNVTTLEYDEKDLYIRTSTDPLGNSVTVTQFDFRVLAPREMQDINDNLSEVVFDALGMPTAMALKGKGNEADNLTDFSNDPDLTNPELETLIHFFTQDYDETEARRLLGNATARYIYNFGEEVADDGNVTYAHRPAGAATILREQHCTPSEESPLQAGFEYSDGSGEVLVKKAQAEPEPGNTIMRWIASGKSILNNKGKPVKQYEPYFSESQHRFEEPREVGVTPIIYYDALGRVVRTRFPDGSFSRVEFTPWQVAAFDQNDTVLEPGHDWYAEKSAPTASAEEQRAAELTVLHTNTPTTVFLDSLGREVISVEHNRFVDETGEEKDEKYVTFTKLDAEGKPLWIRDARGNLVMQCITPPVANDLSTDPVNVFAPCYDIAGNLLFQHSMDSGDRWLINDAAGKPFCAWDLNDRVEPDGTLSTEERIIRVSYDGLHRPLTQELKINTGAWQITEQFIYSEDKSKNLRGQLYQHYDPSGRVTQVHFDFKGNLLEEQKQLIDDPKAEWIDWSDANLESALNPEIFYKQSSYDALGRITRLFNWHTDPQHVAVYEPTYNQRGLLLEEALIMGAELDDNEPNGYKNGERTDDVISAITYDAKGQRQSIRNGNGTRTRYSYDPLTFRLSQLRTTRPGFDPEFPDFHSGLTNVNVLQQLSYTYDPVGNITEIYDEAYEPVFFQNQQVEPRSRYEYDALYRLIKAEGRESATPTTAPGQTGQEPIGVQFPVTDKTLRNYTQRYTYDAVGNIMQMRHIANGGSWTRHYLYAEDSNRLLKTWTGNNELDAIHYQYDTHGSMLNFSNVTDEQRIRWDHRDMIRSANLIGGGWAYYNYDTEKQRTRKRIERQRNIVEERLYLGGMERYRRWKNDQLVEEIETHHLFVDWQRVLMVEDVLRTDNHKLKTGVLYRYHYSNHLSSVALELDEHARIISYEEYHPYGTSAYQAKNADINAAAKRYRYTGKERDDETGLYYYGARYYAAWLGRWTSPDPAEMIDGVNMYQYAHSNPMRFVDPSGCQDIDKSKMLFTWDYLEHLDPKQLEAEMNYRAMPKFEQGKRLTKKEIEEGKRYLEEMEQEANLRRQDLEMLASNPFSSIFYMWARSWSDDPRIHRGAIMAGEATFGIVAARTGFGQHPPTEKKTSQMLPKPRRRINLLPKPKKIKELTPPPSRLVQDPLENRLKELGMERIEMGGGNIGEPIPSTERPRIARPPGTSTEFEMLHPAGLRLGFSEYLDLAIPGSPRINRSYMGMLEIYAAKTFKEGGGGEWQFQIWAVTGQTATHLILRWRPSTLQQGWSFEGVIDVTQTPRMKAAEHRNFLKEILIK